MLSTNDIVKWINEKVAPLIPGIKTYGIAKSAARDESIMPYVDEQYVGLDDTYPAQLYHKQVTIASGVVNGSGYGDNEQSLQNTYTMAMFVFFKENKCGFTADELYTYIQTVITGILKIEGYRTVRVSVSNAILNDSQVWAQEYGQTLYRLAGPQRLIQINYSITAVFDKNCIVIPNCKT